MSSKSGQAVAHKVLSALEVTVKLAHSCELATQECKNVWICTLLILLGESWISFANQRIPLSNGTKTWPKKSSKQAVWKLSMHP